MMLGTCKSIAASRGYKVGDRMGQAVRRGTEGGGRRNPGARNPVRAAANERQRPSPNIFFDARYAPTGVRILRVLSPVVCRSKSVVSQCDRISTGERNKVDGAGYPNL